MDDCPICWNGCPIHVAAKADTTLPPQLFMCESTDVLVTKPFPQQAHTYGLSPLCVLSCIFNGVRCVKPRPQYLQICGFSPVCTLTCSISWSFFVNALEHTWQANGLYPVWIRLWNFSFSLLDKRLPQMSHKTDKSTPASLCLLSLCLRRPEADA